MSNFIEPVKSMMGQASAANILPPYLTSQQCASLLGGVSSSVLSNATKQTGNVLPQLEKSLSAFSSKGYNSAVLGDMQKAMEKLFSSYQSILGNTSSTGSTTSK